MRKKIVLQWVRIVLGLLVFAFGVHLTIYANIGLAPWDCLGMGIAKHTPLNYGLSMTIMAVVILGIDLLLKERIGFGTVIDALLTGNFVQMYNDLNPFPMNEGIIGGIFIMTAGFVFMALGMMIYMKGAQCCGPRDALLVGLGKRFSKVPIGLVEIALSAVKGEEGAVDACYLHLLHGDAREVESGDGRSGGTLVLCVDGLEEFKVFFVGGPLDI